MKKAVILGFISNILMIVGGIWGIGQIVMYFAKNTPFQWWFLLPIAVSILLGLISLSSAADKADEAFKKFDDKFKF